MQYDEMKWPLGKSVYEPFYVDLEACMFCSLPLNGRKPWKGWGKSILMRQVAFMHHKV